MRSKKLSETCAKLKEEIHSENIGRVFDVILEDWHGGYYTGKTKNFMDVKIKNNNENLRGTMQKIKIIDYDKIFLYGGI